MTNIELVNKAIEITKLKTLYVKGGFGQRLTENNKNYLISAYSYNKDRADMIRKADSNTYAFDCCCLIKGVIWGFPTIKYCSNGLPDIGEDTLITKCKASTDFKDVPLGAFLWMKGHCGIYIGDGKAVESTPKWKNGVQITEVANVGIKTGLNKRTWTKWGYLPYITYEDDEMVTKTKIIYNGKEIEVERILKNGTNFIKLKDLEKKFGLCTVGYDAKKNVPIVDSK